MAKKTEEENYQKFLKGVFWIKGWNSRVKEILQTVPDEDRVEMKKLLAELGEKIGREWAKDSGIRKIDSEMLKIWANQLKEAVAIGPTHLVKKLREFERDVAKIIS